jgi:hypothetical protein
MARKLYHLRKRWMNPASNFLGLEHPRTIQFLKELPFSKLNMTPKTIVASVNTLADFLITPSIFACGFRCTHVQTRESEPSIVPNFGC